MCVCFFFFPFLFLCTHTPPVNERQKKKNLGFYLFIGALFRCASRGGEDTTNNFHKFSKLVKLAIRRGVLGGFICLNRCGVFFCLGVLVEI